jgi:hypothetical protein
MEREKYIEGMNKIVWDREKIKRKKESNQHQKVKIKRKLKGERKKKEQVTGKTVLTEGRKRTKWGK